MLSSPDELDESLSGGFTHILIIDGQDLVSWQEFILRGATCRDRGSGPAQAPQVCGMEGKQEGPEHPQSACLCMWLWRAPCRPTGGDRRGQEPRDGSHQGKVPLCFLAPCGRVQGPPTTRPTCCHRAHHHWPLTAGHEAESVAGVALDRHLSERVRRQLPTFHIIATALLRHHMAALRSGGAGCDAPTTAALPARPKPCVTSCLPQGF